MKRIKYLSISLIVLSAAVLVGAQNLDSCLGAFYEFNKTANDATIWGRNGVIHSGSLIGAKFVSDRFGSDSSALSLNNSYISVSDASWFVSMGTFSISVWAHSATGGTFVSQPRAVGGTGIRFSGGSTGISVGLNNGPQNYLLTAPLLLDPTEWHNYIVTYNADSVKLYADNVLVNAAKYSIAFVNSTQPLFIGTESPELGGDYQGDIDDIRIYYRALLPSEVSQIFNFPISKVIQKNYAVNKHIHIPIRQPVVNLEGKLISEKDIRRLTKRLRLY